MERPRLGVSSCLLGSPVRFDGGHKRFRFLTDELGPYVDWVPYCPEVEIGLGTPREPIRLTDSGRLVNRSGTADHTASMDGLPLPSGLDGPSGPSGLEGPSGLDGYVFKAKSPSCGVQGIPRYRSSGEASGAHGPGRYAGRVMAAVPLLAVQDEGRLNDPTLREAFVERVFAAARLRALLSGARDLASGERDLASGERDLVEFHARHKLQLLAHDPQPIDGVDRAGGPDLADWQACQVRELGGDQPPHQRGVEVGFPVVHLHPEPP